MSCCLLKPSNHLLVIRKGNFDLELKTKIILNKEKFHPNQLDDGQKLSKHHLTLEDGFIIDLHELSLLQTRKLIFRILSQPLTNCKPEIERQWRN